MRRGNGIISGLIPVYVFVTYHTTQLGFFADPVPSGITSGRARALAGGVVALISVIIGGLAVARSARHTGRVGSMLAVLLGLIGVVLSVIHLGLSTGGFGTGGGRAGAIVGLVLGLIGMTLGGLAIARSRRIRSTGAAP
jgi:hypothetical protein